MNKIKEKKSSLRVTSLIRNILIYFFFLFVYSQNVEASAPKTFNEIFSTYSSSGFFTTFISFLVLVALVVFLVGVLRFVKAGDNEEQRTAGRSVMIFGIVVLFVIISIWGIVGLFTKSFTDKNPTLPNYLPHLL